MSAIEKLACMQHRRDEVPNQELAKELVKKKDQRGIQEIAENLLNKNKNIQNDCIKVMYEIGCLDPKLISHYAEDFMRLLNTKNNRMIWGAMIALSTIADVSADQMFKHYEEIERAVEAGSVITQDNGIATLAVVASKNDGYRKKIFPFLLKHIEKCRPKDVPQHSEKALIAVDLRNKADFVRVLKKRMDGLTILQTKRVAKVIKEAEAR
jgi:uncharacterized protein (UPF0147 family)